jgi:hypothetical protein
VDITGRLLGQAAIVKDAAIVGVDVNAVIRRLVLFDTYILKSTRLKEFPFLVEHLGFEGTMQLLKSSAFQVECECITTGQTGQVGILESRARKGILPLLSYSLSGIDAGDRRKYIHDCLQPLHQVPGLTQKQVVKVKRALVSKLTRVPEGFAAKLASQATSDVLAKPHLVKKSIEVATHAMLNRRPDAFEVSVLPIDSEDFRVETDLSQRLGISLETTHKVVERGLMGVAGLTQRLLEMQAHCALSGFIEDDLPLLHECLDVFVHNISPQAREQQFSRVLAIAGLPDFIEPGTRRQVNVAKLLEIRESEECTQFREWLRTIQSASDSEIKERLKSLRCKLGNAIRTYPGKVVRFLATTGISSLPMVGPVAGFAAGTIDAFFLENWLPKSGIVAFLSHLYPSVFEERRKNG